jgi:hypothetical protein
MTEDDTFLALSRAPVPEMLRHYKDWVENKNKEFEDLEVMCQRYGWTWNEFSYAGAIWREKYGTE